MRALALAALAGLLLGAAPAMSRPAASTAQARKTTTVKVAIEAMKFSPADVTVKPGDTIVWTNNDVVAHTVTAKAGAFDSKVIPPGATWRFIARKKGDFAYVCSLHQPMTGDLKVR